MYCIIKYFHECIKVFLRQIVAANPAALPESVMSLAMTA